jgi:predicted RNA-binding Zn-ribbon protein involved in translation (DUF1610 family)
MSGPKCGSCGGNLVIDDTQGYVYCESCGAAAGVGVEEVRG